MEAPAVSREPAGAGRGDRLSGLPDCLLENVLSFLTSCQAVRTSVLSRRWRHLWRAVPCVDIDQSEFRAAEAIDVDAAQDAHLASQEQIRRRQEEWDDFQDLADALLPLHPHDASSSPPLETLRLRVSCEDILSARRWIRRGLMRRPVAFHLRCDNDTRFSKDGDKWPYFFPFATPRRHAGAALTLTSRLRTLHLSGLCLCEDFSDAVAAKEFPVLDDMRFEDCSYEFGRLASRSLRKLCMDRCGPRYAVHVLVLAAPCISSLHIHGSGTARVTSEGEMTSLVTASLTLKDRAEGHGFLGPLRYARSLNLSGFSTTAALLDDEDAGGFPVFRNLKTLLLDGCDVGVEFQVLRRFLQNAPNLETITMCRCAFSGGSRSKKRKARHEKTSSSGRRNPTAYDCKHLKSVELEFCERDAIDELRGTLVSCILKEVVEQIQSSVQDGRRRLKISFT